MRYKKQTIGIFALCFVFLLATPTFVLSATVQIGTDPKNDILCAEDIEGIIEFFEEEEFPTREEWEALFERGFDLSARPNYIDVVSYGFANTEDECNLYVQVEDITDVPTCNYSVWFAMIYYNDTFYNEQILFGGIAFNATFDENNSFYFAINQDGDAWADNITIDEPNDRYVFSFDCDWITEDDVDQIYELLYGLLGTVCFDENGTIISFCFDVFPNEYWNANYGNGSNPFGANSNTAGYVEDSGDLITNIFNSLVSYISENWVLLLLLLLVIILVVILLVKNKKKNKGSSKKEKVIKK